MVDMEPLQGKPTEIISTNCYSGSDTPPEDKPYRPRGLWESLTTVVESVTLQLLYASNEVIGYELLLTLQEDSLSPQPFLWIPVVATVVVGWLSRNRWNPETPLFNQLDEQEFNKQHELQIISFMFEPPSNSSHSSMVLFDPPQPNYPHSSRVYNARANTHGGGDGGGWQESQHTLGDNCYIGCCWGRCQYALPNEALVYDNQYDTDQYKNIFADGYGQQTYGQANTEKDYTGGTNHSTHTENCVWVSCLDPTFFFDSDSESTDAATHFTSMNSNSCTTEANSTTPSKSVAIVNPSCRTRIDSSHIENTNSSSRSKVGMNREDEKNHFQCNICDRTFVSKNSLYSHKSHYHSGGLICPECREELPSKKALYDHNRSKHTGVQICLVCNEELPNKKALDDHNRSEHTEEQTCPVPECCKKLPSKKALSNHKSQYHTGKQVCTVCSKTLPNKRALYYHKKKH
ncbi:C2H2-type zinc finger protein [Endozoicomonas montiporae]|nr:C2H2-type zinc finger protein [Endozoicomonas montiporae]